jgi:hypothetical protein
LINRKAESSWVSFRDEVCIVNWPVKIHAIDDSPVPA